MLVSTPCASNMSMMQFLASRPLSNAERHLSSEDMIKCFGAMKPTGSHARDGFTEGYLCVNDVNHWQGMEWGKSIAHRQSGKSERQESIWNQCG